MPHRNFAITLFVAIAISSLTSCTNSSDLNPEGNAQIVSDTAKNKINDDPKTYHPVSKELFDEIAYMDSLMFEAFNAQNLPVFKSMFTPDLEWFQDNGGQLNYENVFENFENNFKSENKLNRKLVRGSLEVYPIKDYGAIETGVHEFRHIENGKEEIGVFKFTHIWKKENDTWKISRVISYDH